MNREDEILSNLMGKMSIDDDDLDGLIGKVEDMRLDAQVDDLIDGLSKMNVRIPKNENGRRQLLVGLKRQRKFRSRGRKWKSSKKQTKKHSVEEMDDMFAMMEKLKQDGGARKSPTKKRSIFGRKTRITQDPISEFQKMKLKLKAEGKIGKTRTMNSMKKKSIHRGGAKGKGRKRSIFGRKIKIEQDPVTEFQKMKLKLKAEGKLGKQHTLKNMRKKKRST